MKKYFLYSLLFVTIFSCKKAEETEQGANPPEETKTTYTVDSSSTTPGMFLTIKSEKTISKDTCTVLLGGTKIILTRIDSLHFGFYVPALLPGTYPLDLKNIGAANTPNVIIQNYSLITNPDKVINDIATSYNNLVDSLLNNSLDSSITSKDASFMRQVMAQLKENIALCTEDQKLLLAYQLRNMNLNPSLAGYSNLDTAYLALRIMEESDDIGRIMLYKVLDAEKARLQAFASAGIVAATGVAALAFPNPFTIGAFLIATGNYLYSINSARKTAGEALDITGIVDGNFSEINGTGTNAKPIVVAIGQTLIESFIASYRTLRKSDETDAVNDDLQDFIKGTYELQSKDEWFAQTFQNMKTKLSSYFKSITINYSPYVSAVLTTAKKKLTKVNSRFISITSISNSDVTVSAVNDGTRLKLTFDNPAKNISQETDFTFTITYNQKEIGNKITLTQQAKFVPVTLPKVTTTIVNSISATSASSGGIITDDGSAPILSKGICYGLDPNPIAYTSSTELAGTGSGSFISNMPGLKPNTTYHVRAFASNSAGTGYGNDISFTTLPKTEGILVGGLIGSYRLVNGVKDYGIDNADKPKYDFVIILTAGYNDLTNLSGTIATLNGNSSGTITGDYSNATVTIVEKSPDRTQSITRTITLTGSFDGKLWGGTYTNSISFTIDPSKNQTTGGYFGFQKQ